MGKIFLQMAILIFLSIEAFGQEKIESLKIVWPEEYKWKIGSNQEDGSVHMIEIIPGNESVDKWTIMGTMMSIKGTKNVPMDFVMNSMFDLAKQNAPKATVSLLEKDESAKTHWIIFKIEAPRFNDDKNPESQLYYVVQGESSLYSNFVAIKEKQLSDEFIEKWKGIFKKSELVYE